MTEAINMMEKGLKAYGVLAALIGIGLSVLSWNTTNGFGPPAPWLAEWTAWIATYAALVIAVGGAVGLTPSILKRLQYVVHKDGSVTDLKNYTATE